MSEPSGLTTPDNEDPIISELAGDAECLRELREWDAVVEANVAMLTAAERPVVADLQAAGVQVESVWDVNPARWPYPEALPILVDHLERGRYPGELMQAIGWALSVKASLAYWDRIRAVFLTSNDKAQQDAAALALAGCAGSRQLSELIDFVRQEDRGESRVYFLRPINRIGRERGRAVIAGLVKHPVLGVEATAISKGRGRND